MKHTRITWNRLAIAAVAIVATAELCLAAGTPIGLLVADGSLEVDGARVTGNATIFDGSVVRSGRSVSQLRIGSTMRMRLGAQAKARVYQRKLVLEAGDSQYEGGAGYEIEAQTLRISAQGPDTVARIRLTQGNRVMVAAVRGRVSVANSAGFVVANIERGSSLDFEPQAAGAAAPTQVSGCLLLKGGKWIVVDQTTNAILEVTGDGMIAQLGNRVMISGTPAGKTDVIKVAGMKLFGKGGCAATAKKVGATASATAAAAGAAGAASGAGAAAAGAGTAAAAGIGIGTVAVIGGVAAAATIGGLAAVGGLPGQGEDPPSASR